MAANEAGVATTGSKRRTERGHMKARSQTAGLRAAEGLFGGAGCRRVVRVARASIAVMGDALVGAGLVVSGLVAWSPRIGITAAAEHIAQNRAERLRIAEIERVHGAVWARHARRRIRRRRIARIVEGLGHPTSDP